MQVTQALHHLLQQEPDRPLTVYDGRVRTVAESADRVARLADGLRSAGAGDGDRVGMLALNSDRFHEFLLAVPWAGAVVNPVNIRWSPAAPTVRTCIRRLSPAGLGPGKSLSVIGPRTRPGGRIDAAGRRLGSAPDQAYVRTTALVRDEGQMAAVVLADVAAPMRARRWSRRQRRRRAASTAWC
jgi:acyl-coenzyme A synthetase/AMP-(fatty) acid ligase